MILLCIMDGFGLRDPLPDNAIAAAYKPTYDRLIKTCPHTKIDGSGKAVGLPVGQMGNSEVGHLNLGAGRVVYQDITRIDNDIETGDFFKNEAFVTAMDRAVENGNAVHLFGLVSDGQVHSSMNHLFALAELAKQRKVKQLYLHALMDGRDTSPTAGKGYMNQVVARFKEIGVGQVSTVGGRYYGMDRDKRWERTDKAYEAAVHGVGEKYRDPIEGIEASNKHNVTDEFIVPFIVDLGDSGKGRIKDGDTIIYFNFRADRARQLCYMFMGNNLPGINHPDNPRVHLVTMTNYDEEMTGASVAYQPIKLNRILAEILSERGLKQLHTAETEKYAHVTFFFNGGREEPFAGEERQMIQSPRIATYDLKPEMSSVELTDHAVEQITSGKFDFVLLNYANCDMVGHTGVFEAAKQAAEAVDRGLGRLIAAVEKVGGVALVTADHGNAEMMVDPESGGPFTAHTTNLVPFIVCDTSGKLPIRSLREGGVLADVAPTILDLMGIEQPREMTGKSLIIRG